MMLWAGVVAGIFSAGLLGFAVGYILGAADERAAWAERTERRARRGHPARLRALDGRGEGA